MEPPAHGPMTEVADHPDTLRRAGLAVVALGASELLGKVATFLTLLLLARLLGVAEFGVFSFGLSIGLLLAVLSSLDLDERVIQIGSARPDLLDRCFGALIAIRAVLSVVVMAVATVVVFATMGLDDASAIFYLVAACLLDTFSDAARAACGALQRQELSALVLVLQRFSALGLSVGALIVSRDGEFAALGYLVATAIGVAAMQVAARRAGARPRIRGSMPEIRMVVRAAPVTALDSIAAMGIFRLDAALIGVILGTNAVGVYGASYRIFESVLFVSWTLSRAYVPVVASRPDDPEHMRAWAQRSLVVVCAAYLPYGVVLALRGEDLVGLLFGSAYVDRGLLIGLAAAPLCFGIAHLSASMLLALRPDPVVGLASVSALALNVGLNLWLIPVWGLTAAAMATTLAFLLRALILTTALTRITGSIFAVRPLAVVAVAAAAVAVVVDAIPSVALALPAAVAVFVVLWVTGSRWADPTGFAGLVNRLRRREATPTPGGART